MSDFVCPESGNPLVPNCKLVADTLSDYLEDRLSDKDRILLDEHLSACPLCLVYLEQFREIYHAVERVDVKELPRDFDAVMGRVIERWQGECDRRDAG